MAIKKLTSLEQAQMLALRCASSIAEHVAAVASAVSDALEEMATSKADLEGGTVPKTQLPSDVAYLQPDGKMAKGTLPDDLVYSDTYNAGIAEVQNAPLTEDEIDALWSEVFGP